MVRIEPLLWRVGGEMSRSVSIPHVKYSVAADTGICPSVLPPIHLWLSDPFFPQCAWKDVRETLAIMQDRKTWYSDCGDLGIGQGPCGWEVLGLCAPEDESGMGILGRRT